MYNELQNIDLLAQVTASSQNCEKGLVVVAFWQGEIFDFKVI